MNRERLLSDLQSFISRFDEALDREIDAGIMDEVWRV
jgi:hypothetical protein